MKTLRTLISLALLTCAVAGSGYFLIKLKSAARLPGPGELLNAPPEEAVYGAVWLLAAAATAWVGLTSILSVFAYAARIPAAVRAVEWMTLPPIRRLSQRVSALMLAATAGLTGPAAGAIALPPIPFTAGPQEPAAAGAEFAVRDQGPPGGAAIPIALRTDGPAVEYPRAAGFPASAAAPVPLRVGEQPADHPRVAAPPPAAEAPAAPHRPGPAAPIILRVGGGAPSERSDPEGTAPREATLYTVYTVQPGDNMWSIAAACLTDREGPPSAERTAELWRRVIELNRDRIISGNPGLIFPGEQLLLPPPGETGRGAGAENGAAG